MSLICKTKFLLVAVALTILIGGTTYAEDWKVGEKWTYKHEGPRPLSDPSVTIKGDRTVEVTKIEGEGAAKVDQWYHPKIKNFVKEVGITNYQGDNSYTGTSVLKSHATPK